MSDPSLDEEMMKYPMTREYYRKLVDLIDILQFTHVVRERRPNFSASLDIHDVCDKIFLFPISIILGSGYAIKDLALLEKIFNSRNSLMKIKVSDRGYSNHFSLLANVEHFSEVSKILKRSIEDIVKKLPNKDKILIYLDEKGVYKKFEGKDYRYNPERNCIRDIFLRAIVKGPKNSKDLKDVGVDTNFPQTAYGLNKIINTKLYLNEGDPFILNNDDGYFINKEKYTVQKVSK